MNRSAFLKGFDDHDPARLNPEHDATPDERALLSSILATPRHDAGPVWQPRHDLHRRRLFSGAVVATCAVAAAVAVIELPPPGAPHQAARPGNGGPSSHARVVAFLTDAAKIAAQTTSVPTLGSGQYFYEKNVITSRTLCRLTTDAAGHASVDDGPGTSTVPSTLAPSDSAPATSPSTLASVTPFSYTESLFREEWQNDDFAGGLQESLDGTGTFGTSSEQQAWQAAGSPSLELCAYPVLSQLNTFDESAKNGEVIVSLPTDPEKLGALIAAGRVNDIGQLLPPSGQCPSKAGDAKEIYPPGAVCPVSAQFDIAENLLVAPQGPALLGPALYDLLAQLPGVENIGTVTDELGRSGTAIEDPSTGKVFVIDPSTGQLLEQEDVSTSNNSGDSPLGTVDYSTTFGPLSVVSGVGTRPTAGAMPGNSGVPTQSVPTPTPSTSSIGNSGGAPTSS